MSVLQWRGDLLEIKCNRFLSFLNKDNNLVLHEKLREQIIKSGLGQHVTSKKWECFRWFTSKFGLIRHNVVVNQIYCIELNSSYILSCISARVDAFCHSATFPFVHDPETYHWFRSHSVVSITRVVYCSWFPIDWANTGEFAGNFCCIYSNKLKWIFHALECQVQWSGTCRHFDDLLIQQMSRTESATWMAEYVAKGM